MSHINPVALAEMQRFAEQVAMEAAEVIRGYAKAPPRVERKSDASPVTEADREAEQLIRARIHASYPNHGVLGEEGGFERGAGEITWVIDPIDGTRSFVAGVPLYATLIAAIAGDLTGDNPTETSHALVGVIELPATHQAVSASRGNGARTRLADGSYTVARVSPIDALAQGIVCTTDFADLARRNPALHQVITESGAQTRTWGDAFGYFLLATGRVEVMIDPIMNPWDVAPVPVIIEEAGGSFSTTDGKQFVGESALATNGRVQLFGH
ncbi:MAG: inositol monophosphatase family protein [Spirochaetales bacterium]